MLDKKNGAPLYKAKKEAHIDQLGFCMAAHENNIPVKYLGSLYNYHVLLDYAKPERVPYVLHYHTAADKKDFTGIELDYEPEGNIKKAVETANGFMGEYSGKLKISSPEQLS
jgi:hypothetical protein